MCINRIAADAFAGWDEIPASPCPRSLGFHPSLRTIREKYLSTLPEISNTVIPAKAHYCPARFLRESINRLMAVIPANAGIHLL